MVIDSSVPVALLLFNEGNILLSGHMSGIHTGYTSHPVSLTHSLLTLSFSRHCGVHLLRTAMSQAFLSQAASLDEVYIILIAKSADRLAFFSS